ncbi:MAG: DUF1641 domain-containing protein [Thermoplasmata archaeon]|uniref:DUF1641 domain-containing protein n=1 Tax=Candidatus Sysuiplasma superficiale TaxID=2823368 RepID=A0A8J7YXS2_9ARCH|nr:DUF1641 domain-containing protein [Candidatus Sysuiplasma superficiale]MBX8644346.1 DUF1641 domain-containing protein [Candidatus Sysuiplasma superficiale]
MSGANSEGSVGVSLSAEEERQLREFLANLPRFNALVNNFSRMEEEGQIDALSAALAAVRFFKDGLNDEAIESLASAAGRIAEAAAAISSESSMSALKSLETEGESVSDLLKQISAMQKDGVFESLVSASYALKFLRDGLNDEAVENIASNLSEMLSLLRQYSALLSSGELVSALETLSRMQRDGTIEALADAAYVLKFLRDGLNDEALSNIASIFSQLLSQWNSLHGLIDMMSSPIAARVIRAITDESIEERLEAAQPKKGGMSLLSLSDPDVKKGVGVVFELLKIIGEEFGGKK